MDHAMLLRAGMMLEAIDTKIGEVRESGTIDHTRRLRRLERQRDLILDELRRRRPTRLRSPERV